MLNALLGILGMVAPVAAAIIVIIILASGYVKA